MSSSPSIFIDESGKFDFVNKEGYYVICYLFCKNPENLRSAMKRQIMRLHNYDIYPDKLKELKFYPKRKKLIKHYSRKQIQQYKDNLPEVRRQTVSLIVDYCDGIFISLLENQLIRETTWTSERLGNYVIAVPLIQNVTPILPIQKPPKISFDKGRLSIENMQEFYKYLKDKDSFFGLNYAKYGENISNFDECDSISEPCIWATDMVAGSFYDQCVHGDNTYVDIVSSKLIGIGVRNIWKRVTP